MFGNGEGEDGEGVLDEGGDGAAEERVQEEVERSGRRRVRNQQVNTAKERATDQRVDGDLVGMGLVHAVQHGEKRRRTREGVLLGQE